MNTIYQLHANELNGNFLNSVKALFKGRKITIAITTEIDETEYLLQSEANRKQLFDSINNLKKKKNIITFNNIKELKQAVLNEADNTGK